MNAYICKTLAGQLGNVYSFQMKSDLLYKNVTYPSIGEDMHVTLLNSPENTEEVSPGVNAGIQSWMTWMTWITRMQQVGNSANLSKSLTRNPDIRIKYPRSDKPAIQERGLYEYFIGTVMNKLRKKIPHFVYTLGAFKCSSETPPTINQTVQQFCRVQTDSVFHLVQERVEGQTFDAWLKHEPGPEDAKTFYLVILQIALALAKAQDKKGFVHNALFASNIILRPCELSTVTFQFGSQVYQIAINGVVPTVIDYSSARATHKGFGICYLSNPTIFTPGKDLCKLVASSLALINNSKLYAEVSWVNEFFHNFYDVTNVSAGSAGSYDELINRYSGFDLPDDHPLASVSPMDFINWFRGKNGELFNKLVTVRGREIREVRIPKLSQKNDARIDAIPSAVLKTFALAEYGTTYSATPKEREYDSQLLSRYSAAAKPTTIYSVNYNFPLKSQYNASGVALDYHAILSDITRDHLVLKNYITFTRYAKTVSALPDFQITSQVFTDVEKLKYNINIISNLPLYKLYQIASARVPLSGLGSILYRDLYQAASWIKQLYPVCIDYLDSVVLPDIETRMKQPTASGTYYPTCTLSQFTALLPGELKPVLGIMSKIFFGLDIPKAKLERIVSTKEDDVAIFLALRKLYIPSEFDRGKNRVKELGKLMKYLPQQSFTSYLDFGGGDGSISSATATVFNISKEAAFSADIDKWFGKQAPKTYDNITYLHLKEGQRIPLPDKSIDLVTCYQVLHHIKDIDFVLTELRRICKQVLIIREHDCRGNTDRMLIDLEHSMYELCVEPEPNIKFLNDYEAWYHSKEEWASMLQKYGFKTIHTTDPKGSTRYYYAIMTV
jgi:ubiquinone/menaquinone biosynthesis C-methylase UbiE/serine/threonine protein kinase